MGAKKKKSRTGNAAPKNAERGKVERPDYSTIPLALNSIISNNSQQRESRRRILSQYAEDMHRINQESCDLYLVLLQEISVVGWQNVFRDCFPPRIDRSSVRRGAAPATVAPLVVDEISSPSKFYEWICSSYFMTLVCTACVEQHQDVEERDSKFAGVVKKLRDLYKREFVTGNQMPPEPAGPYMTRRLKRPDGTLSTNNHLLQLGITMSVNQLVMCRTVYLDVLIPMFVNTGMDKKQHEQSIQDDAALSADAKRNATRDYRKKLANMKKAFTANPNKPLSDFDLNGAHADFVVQYRPHVAPPLIDWCPANGEYPANLRYTMTQKPEIIMPV